MTIVHLSGNRITGVSGDAKPTLVATNSVFIETDTNKTYKYNGSAWVGLDVGVGDSVANTELDGNITLSKLSTTGTASSDTYLRGDNTWSQVSGIPSGVILMWSGTLANIPSGWNLCDGNNGTPNLIAKFVRSIATASTEAGSTGGSDDVTLTGSQSGTSAHGHSGSGSTNSTGDHSHQLHIDTNSNAVYGNYTHQGSDRTGTSSASYGKTNNAGSHSHTVSLSVSNASEANASSSHENRPAYFELAYIMKA